MAQHPSQYDGLTAENLQSISSHVLHKDRFIASFLQSQKDFPPVPPATVHLGSGSLVSVASPVQSKKLNEQSGFDTPLLKRRRFKPKSLRSPTEADSLRTVQVISSPHQHLPPLAGLQKVFPRGRSSDKTEQRHEYGVDGGSVPEPLSRPEFDIAARPATKRTVTHQENRAESDEERSARLADRRERKRAKRAIIDPKARAKSPRGAKSADHEADDSLAGYARPSHKGGKKSKKAKTPAGMALMYGFAANNVGKNRLTLAAAPIAGVFNKGKASARIMKSKPSNALSKHAFNEIVFLNKTRCHSVSPSGNAEEIDRKDTSSAGGSEHPPSATKNKRFVITNATPTKARSMKELVSRLPSAVSDLSLEERNCCESEVWAIEQGFGLPSGSDCDPLERRDTEVSHITLDYGAGRSRPLWATLQPSNCAPPPLPQIDPPMSDLETSAKGDAAGPHMDDSNKPASILSRSSLAPWHSASQCDAAKDTAHKMFKPTTSHFFAISQPFPAVEIPEASITANRAKGVDHGQLNRQNWTPPVSLAEVRYAHMNQKPQAFAAMSAEHISDERPSPPPSSIVSFDSLQLALRLHEAEDKSALMDSDGMDYVAEGVKQSTSYGLEICRNELPGEIPTDEQPQGHSDSFRPDWFFPGAETECEHDIDVACNDYHTRAEERDPYHFTSDLERLAALVDLDQDDRSDIVLWPENAFVEGNHPEFPGNDGVGVYGDSDQDYLWRGYSGEPDTYTSFYGSSLVDAHSDWTQGDDGPPFAGGGILSTALEGSESASSSSTASLFDTVRPESDHSMEEPLLGSSAFLDGIRSEKRLDGGGVSWAEVDVAKTLRDHWFPQRL